MIEVTVDEPFPISVTLIDEESPQLVSGKLVSYDVRTLDDLVLSPPVSGILLESTVEPGVYKKAISLPLSGAYMCYVTCSGFFTNSEDILVNDCDVSEVVKYTLPYNVSVIDVTRDNVTASASQLSRKVALGNTDYITTLVKRDYDLDWSNPVSSGNSYAHYSSTTTDLPYKMGGEY